MSIQLEQTPVFFVPHQDASSCELYSQKLRQYLSSIIKPVFNYTKRSAKINEDVNVRRLELENVRAQRRIKLLYIEALRRAAEEEQRELLNLEKKCESLVSESNLILSRQRPRITLPVEIVLQILSYLWPPSTQNCARPLGVRPTEVAIAPSAGLGWKSAIANVNSWSRVRRHTTRSTQPTPLRQALRSSAPARLDIHLGDMYPGTDAFLAVVAEFRDRWDTLSINAAYWNRQGASFSQLRELGVALSSIRNLIIYPHDYCQVGLGWVSSWCRIPSDLESDEVPRLRTADIPASCLPSFTQIFSRLHSLTLHISQPLEGCARGSFSGLKALVRLSMLDCSHAREFFSDVRSSKPIVLPYLRELAVDAIDSNAIPVVASSLSCPKLCSLTIGKIRFPSFNNAERNIEVYQALAKGLSASYPGIETLDLRTWPNHVLYDLLKEPGTGDCRWLFPCLTDLKWDMTGDKGIGVSGEIKRLIDITERRHESDSCNSLRVLQIDLASYAQKVENAVHLQAAHFYGLDVIVHIDSQD